MHYFNHSKRDIRSLSILYKICTLLAVIPCDSFKNTNVTSTAWKKIKGLLLIGGISIGTAYSMYFRHIFYKNLYTLTHLVLDYIDEFFVVMIAFTVIFNSCFCSKDCWIKLNNNLQHIDEVLKNKDKKEQNLLRNISIQFTGYFLVYVFNVLFLMYIWMEKMGVESLQSHALHQFCYVYDLLLHFLIFTICSALQCRYDDLNDLLESEANEYSENNIMTSLRKIENVSQILSETVNLFNEVFGTPLIFITGKSITQLLTCLNFLTNNLKIDDVEFKHRLFVANVTLVIYTLVSVSYIMISADRATASSTKTTSLCYKFQEQFVTKSEARLELFKLAQQTTASTAVITAANFFQINKATLFGLFGTTTTYFIVILQFNQSLSGN
ncbi:uncharacterized protein LOC135127326 [Zophobas morio]|uniref:uncharacterized protein LOC135127326 n=1 Tax=Zophobas morio TaxID=2755281 RepID=UPI0030834CC9